MIPPVDSKHVRGSRRIEFFFDRFRTLAGDIRAVDGCVKAEVRAEVETSDDVTGAAKDKECAENGKADFLRKNQTGAVLARAGSFFPGFRGIAVVQMSLSS